VAEDESPEAPPTEPTPSTGLRSAEAQRRLLQFGPNELVRLGGVRWPRELAAQFVHPLALLLWAAAALAVVVDLLPLAGAIVAVVILNALFAFLEERQAERAVEALGAYLPPHATVLRDGRRIDLVAREIVPGDLLLIAEGQRICADARLVHGAVQIDASALTGESQRVERQAGPADDGLPPLERTDLVFSGTSCTAGEARAVVLHTGMATELGRVAALSQRVREAPSPLQQEITRVARLIAIVAVVVGIAFVPIGTLGAGLPIRDAVVFAIGLLVANVPEGLLPTITLALAVGVRQLTARRALVKRLSAVETLGSTTVICTDKTGTLTQNQMRATAVWTLAGEASIEDGDGLIELAGAAEIARVAAGCTEAELHPPGAEHAAGDPTEIALLQAAERLGGDPRLSWRARVRRKVFAFDPQRKRMATIDALDDGTWVQVKGAPDQLLTRCTTVLDGTTDRPLDAPTREAVLAAVEAHAAQGLRVMGFARRAVADAAPLSRDAAESELQFLGLVALMDPPRPEVAEAVQRCHEAGIRIVIVTGDHGLTAAEIARRVGIGRGEIPQVVDGSHLDAMTDGELGELLSRDQELVFSRSSPEAKLRIAELLKAQGHVVAMTGDGVNDAPALRSADIGVAMGGSGTDVAREAATLVLTDDNFATIVAAVEEGRRIYENIRKFVLYIFAHATPEVVPFLVFALSGGAVPLPLTALQILAIDLGTETLPALALGRDPAEPGIMRRAPRPRHEGVITREMLWRAWGFLGLISAALVLGAFFAVLLQAGWSAGAPTEAGSPLHGAYVQATTVLFAGIVSCQIGTAFAARTHDASLRQVGVFANPLLLWGIAFELLFTAAVIWLPPLQSVFGTAGLDAWMVLMILPFGPIVWGADELRRQRARRRAAR
jgi:calcium-translocating P-type ATPase